MSCCRSLVVGWSRHSWLHARRGVVRTRHVRLWVPWGPHALHVRRGPWVWHRAVVTRRCTRVVLCWCARVGWCTWVVWRCTTWRHLHVGPVRRTWVHASRWHLIGGFGAARARWHRLTIRRLLSWMRLRLRRSLWRHVWTHSCWRHAPALLQLVRPWRRHVPGGAAVMRTRRHAVHVLRRRATVAGWQVRVGRMLAGVARGAGVGWPRRLLAHVGGVVGRVARGRSLVAVDAVDVNHVCRHGAALLRRWRQLQIKPNQTRVLQPNQARLQMHPA